MLAAAVLTGKQAKYKTFFRNGEYIPLTPFSDSELLPGQESPGQVLFDDDSTDSSDDGHGNTIASRLAEVGVQGWVFEVPGLDGYDGSNVK